MALNINNFSTRLGKLFGYANSVKTQIAALYGSNLTSIFTSFDGTAYRGDISNLTPLSTPQTGLPSQIAISLYSQIQTSVNMFVIDAIRQEESVYDGTATTALKKLRDVMTATSKSFQAVTSSSATYTAGSGNQGNGTIIITDQRPPTSAGFTLQELFTETINGTCIVGGNVSNFGAATFRLSGLAALPPYNVEYPTGNSLVTIYGGSGVETNINCTSASITSSLGQAGLSLLSNGDFESWSATNTPTNWSIITGTAGTQITRGSTAARGTYALQIVGDGATLTRLRQQIASSNGAPSSVSAETQYCIACMARVSATGGTGIITVNLRDSAGTAVGTAITLRLSGGTQPLTATYQIYTSTFSVARGSLPTTLYLDIASTTVVSAGKTVMVDELIFAPMIPLYAGGPSVIAYSGSTDWNIQDNFTLSVISDTDDGAAGNEGLFMKSFQRWFRTEAQGIYLPVAASPTQADSYVTI